MLKRGQKYTLNVQLKSSSNILEDVIITDQNNCISNQSININQPDSINIIIDQVIDAYCQDQNDGQISISVIGGTSAYDWDNRSFSYYKRYLGGTVNNEVPSNMLLSNTGQISTDFKGLFDFKKS